MKPIAIILILLFCLLIASVARSQVKSKSFRFVLNNLLAHKVPEISVEKAAASPSSYTFLDSREAEEYKVSHLPNALHVGYQDFKINNVKNLRKDQPIIVYCSIGKRSENIAEKLIKEGYTNVYNLYGGIFEWINQGKPVIDMNSKPTTSIHAYNRLWGRFLSKGNKVY